MTKFVRVIYPKRLLKTVQKNKERIEASACKLLYFEFLCKSIENEMTAEDRAQLYTLLKCTKETWTAAFSNFTSIMTNHVPDIFENTPGVFVVMFYRVGMIMMKHLEEVDKLVKKYHDKSSESGKEIHCCHDDITDRAINEYKKAVEPNLLYDLMRLKVKYEPDKTDPSA